MTIWRMRIACWIAKARDKQSQYLIIYCSSTTTLVAWTTFEVTL